jgi:hypothetical protein
VTRVALIAVAALVLLASGCSAPVVATEDGDIGHWAITKYLVRVYETDEQTAVDAGHQYFDDHGFGLDEKTEPKNGETVHVLHGFTLGGRLAYHLGQGTSLILRIRRRDDSPGLIVVEAKHGPHYTLLETAAILDGYEQVLQTLMEPPLSEGDPRTR